MLQEREEVGKARGRRGHAAKLSALLCDSTRQLTRNRILAFLLYSPSEFSTL